MRTRILERLKSWAVWTALARLKTATAEIKVAEPIVKEIQ